MNIPDLYEKYGQEKVDEEIKHLTYKKVPAELHKEESDQYPTMYIFRHGETEDNANMVFSGWRDSKLTKKGEKEALKLADKLADKKIQMLIVSDQVRSLRTMELAMSKNKYAKGLQPHTDPRIKERGYGDLQGQSKLEWKLKDPDLTKKYRRSYDFPPPNGESLKAVVKRVNEFLEEIIPLMKEEKINIAISCHGNSIRGFRKYFENLTETETANVETPTGKDYASYVVK